MNIKICPFLFQLIAMFYTLHIDKIYSPSPIISIKLSQTANIQDIQIAKDTNILFYAAGKEGIIVIDGSNNLEVSKIIEFGTVELLSVDKEGQYLFFSYNEYISMFEVQITSQGYNLKLLSSDQTPRGMAINRLLLFNNDQWAAGQSGSMIIVYDITNKYQFIEIGSIDYGFSTFKIVMIIDAYIIAAGDELKIIKYQKDTNSSYLKLFSVLESLPSYYFESVTLTSDKKFLYALDNWGGFSYSTLPDIDKIGEGETIIDFVFDVENWWLTPSIPLLNEIILSKDENFAFIGVQQIGIFIFDISNRFQDHQYPQLFQWIRLSGFPHAIRLSPDEQYLYFANGISFSVFSKGYPNLNLDYPNLLNLMQVNFSVIGDSIYRWRCYITSQGKYFVGAFDKSGLFIFDIENDPFKLDLKQNIVPLNDNYFDSAIVDEENGYIITAGDNREILLYVYQFPIVNKVPIATLVYGQQIWIEGICYNKQKSLIAVAGYNKLILIDSRRGLQLKVYNQLDLSFQIQELIFSNDNKYLLGIARNTGIASFDISDPTSIKFKQILKTAGGYSIIGSQDGNYAFVGDGAMGIGIIDMNQLPDIVFISRIGMEGIIFQITPIKSDQFLLVSSNVLGFLQVVDIRNKSNLQIVQKFVVKGQNGLASCASPDGSFAFLTNYSGVTSISLVSDIIVHTQIFQVFGRESFKLVYQNKSPSTTFLVGQYFQLQFYTLYPPPGIQLTSIYYYSNFEVVQLPFWMNFNSQLSFLDISVDKQALSQDFTTSSLNTIVLEYKTPLTVDKFLYQDQNGIVTTQEQSELIHSALRLMNLINYENYLILSNFERQEPFRFKSENSFLNNAPQGLLDKVKQTIQKSVNYNIVTFKAASSLKFYENPTVLSIEEGGDGVSQYFVFSIQNSIQLYLQTTVEAGKFVESYYEGVIAQISNFDTYLKLEGSVKNVNNVLKNLVLFFMTAEKESDVSFHIIIVDGVNYVIEKDISLQNANQFIKLKKKISLTPGKELQIQFNAIFSGGSVNIEESLSFEFSKDTFINPDTTTINYKAYFWNEGKYVDSLEGDWIQQSSSSLRFFGLVPALQYRTILRIKVEASDGYTSTDDEFNIYVYGIPFVFVFTTAVKIFGPIITVLGIYKSRSYFFNIAFSKKNLYKKEVVYENQPYQKIINIISNENIKAILLFKLLLKKIASSDQITLPLHRGLTERVSQLSKSTKKKQTICRTFPQHSTDFENPFMNMKQEKKETNKDISPQFVMINQKIKEIIDKIILLLRKLENEVKASNTNKKSKGKRGLENEFIDNQGEIKMLEIIKKMVEFKLSFKLNNQTYDIEKIVPELIKPTSRLHSSLKAVISRHFLMKNLLLYHIYLFLKESAEYETKRSSNTTNDWYLKYINIKNSVTEQESISQNKIKNDQNPIQVQNISNLLNNFQQLNNEKHSNKDLAREQFLTLEIDSYQLQKQLTIMKQFINQFYDLNSDSQSIFQNLPFKLLAFTLIADYQGLVLSPPSAFAPSVGESIHLNFFDIDSVQAFKNAENLNCLPLRRMFGFQIVNYGLSKNQQLPSWMKFSQQQSAIILYGTPNREDVETFILRVYDETGYIARQYEIEVKHQEIEEKVLLNEKGGEEEEDEENIKDSTSEINIQRQIEMNTIEIQKCCTNLNEMNNSKKQGQSRFLIEEQRENKNGNSEIFSPISTTSNRSFSEYSNKDQDNLMERKNKILILRQETSFMGQFQ